MSRYSPSGIGTYQPRRNLLAESLGQLSDRVGGYFREQRRQQFEDAQRAASERFRMDLFDRQEASIADREKARLAREDAARALELRLSHGVAPKASAGTELVTLPDGTTRERWVPLEGTDYVQDWRRTPEGAEGWGKAETRAESNRLADVLTRMSVQGVADADATPAGPDYFGVQALRALEDPAVLRQQIATSVMQPDADRRALEQYRQRKVIDRQFAPPRAPVAPRTMMIGGLPYQVGAGGILQPMTLPDGSQPTLANKPPTQAQAQRAAFGTMAAQAASRLGDDLSDEELAALEEAGNGPPLGLTAPSMGEILRGAVPVVGNAMQGAPYQLRQAAIQQLADSWLRYTSGAAVPETEVARFSRAFTPQYGDESETLRDKRTARRLIVEVLNGQRSSLDGLAELARMGVRTPAELRGAIGAGEVDPEQIDPDILAALEDQ